jgi:hypothetical protein
LDTSPILEGIYGSIDVLSNRRDGLTLYFCLLGIYVQPLVQTALAVLIQYLLNGVI